MIRRVGSDGIIRTIAGSGQRGFDGDGGAALSAKFDSPQSLAVDSQGRIYINDEHNNAIRVLDPDGTVRTLVGTRGPGFSGDGGPAHLAQIADPEGILVRSDGSILITARDNSRVRIVTPGRHDQHVCGPGAHRPAQLFRADPSSHRRALISVARRGESRGSMLTPQHHRDESVTARDAGIRPVEVFGGDVQRVAWRRSGTRARGRPPDRRASPTTTSASGRADPSSRSMMLV